MFAVIGSPVQITPAFEIDDNRKGKITPATGWKKS